jgi:hypothetical protein
MVLSWQTSGKSFREGKLIGLPTKPALYGKQKTIVCFSDKWVSINNYYPDIILPKLMANVIPLCSTVPLHLSFSRCAFLQSPRLTKTNDRGIFIA